MRLKNCVILPLHKCIITILSQCRPGTYLQNASVQAGCSLAVYCSQSRSVSDFFCCTLTSHWRNVRFNLQFNTHFAVMGVAFQHCNFIFQFFKKHVWKKILKKKLQLLEQLLLLSELLFPPLLFILFYFIFWNYAFWTWSVLTHKFPHMSNVPNIKEALN